MNVSVVFNADTGKYEARLEGMDRKTAASAQAVANAKNKIVSYHQEQIASAVKLGRSAEDLERIQRKSAESLANVTEANANKIIASLDRVQEKNRRVAAELQALSIPKVAESHGVSDRMATSAAVRGLEGNPGIRSIENFITMSPIAAKAMQSLFPLIGAAGLAGLFVDMGIKAYEAFQKVIKAAEASREAFAEMHDKSLLLITDKEIENQKIQDQIDKISGHPNNGLAMALLEAKKMADQLVVSLQEDRKQLDALLKEHNTGALGTALSVLGIGPQSTGLQEKEMLKDQLDLMKQVRTAKNEFNAAMAKAPDDAARTAATQAYNKSVRAAFQKQIDIYGGESKRLADAESQIQTTVTRNGVIRTHEDHSQQRSNADGRLAQLKDMLSGELLDESIYAGNVKLGKVKQNKELSGFGDKEAAKKLHEFEATVAEMELNGATPKAIFDFWDRARLAFTSGSEQFGQVVEKQASIAKSAAEKVARALAEARAGNTQAAYDMLTGRKEPAKDEGPRLLDEATRAAGKMAGDFQHAADESADSRAQLTAMQERGKAQQQEIALNEQAGRSITKLDALRQMAKLHQEGFAADLDRLDFRRHTILNAKYLDEPQRQRDLASVAAQRATIVNEANATAQRDAFAVGSPDSSALVGAKDALNEFTDAARDSARMMEELTKSTLSQFNHTLIEIMTGQGHRGQWKDFGRGVATHAAGFALNKAEGFALSALGFGKADGSKQNPFSVQIVGGLPGMGGAGTLSGLGQLLFPDKAGDFAVDTTSTGKKALGGIFGAISRLLPIFGGGRALGGGVQAGWAYDVGEMGRETFIPSTSGTIVPHSSLRGTAAHYSINVPYGVTPEQMHMFVQSSLKQFHPVVVRDSVQASAEHRQRNTTKGS